MLYTTNYYVIIKKKVIIMLLLKTGFLKQIWSFKLVDDGCAGQGGR